MYLMSAPAMKAFSPAPVSTTTRASGSPASSVNRPRSSSACSTSTAFIASGRLTVTTAMPALRSISMLALLTETCSLRKSTIRETGAPGVKTSATPCS